MSTKAKVITNREANQCVATKELFRNTTGSIYSEWVRDDMYVVYSYGEHFPLFIFVEGQGWFENGDSYSRTTSKHNSHAHPSVPTKKLNTDGMVKLAKTTDPKKLLREGLPEYVPQVDGRARKLVNKEVKEQYKDGIKAFKEFAAAPIAMFHQAKFDKESSLAYRDSKNALADLCVQKFPDWFRFPNNSQSISRMILSTPNSSKAFKKLFREMLKEFGKDEPDEIWYDLALAYIEWFVYCYDQRTEQIAFFTVPITDDAKNHKNTTARLNTCINEAGDFYRYE